MLKDCDKDKGYEGGGRRREQWWRQTAYQKQLSETLKEISATARAQRWKYGRRGEGGEGKEVVELESKTGSDGPWYSGTETGDSQVGEWSCVDTRRWKKGKRDRA